MGFSQFSFRRLVFSTLATFASVEMATENNERITSESDNVVVKTASRCLAMSASAVTVDSYDQTNAKPTHPLPDVESYRSVCS